MLLSVLSLLWPITSTTNSGSRPSRSSRSRMNCSSFIISLIATSEEAAPPSALLSVARSTTEVAVACSGVSTEMISNRSQKRTNLLMAARMSALCNSYGVLTCAPLPRRWGFAPPSKRAIACPCVLHTWRGEFPSLFVALASAPARISAAMSCADSARWSGVLPFLSETFGFVRIRLSTSASSSSFSSSDETV